MSLRDGANSLYRQFKISQADDLWKYEIAKFCAALFTTEMVWQLFSKIHGTFKSTYTTM